MPATATTTAPRKPPPRKTKGKGKGPHVINGLALGVPEAAQFYGGTVKQTRGLIERQMIPFRRLGGRIIFLRSELEEWLATLPGVTLDEARANQEARRSGPNT